MKRILLINESDPEERRIAVVENGVLQEIHIDNPSREVHLGNIYWGKVVNVEPSIGAAFVNYGGSRNGFLHASDVHPGYARPDPELVNCVLGKCEGTRAAGVPPEEEPREENRQDDELRPRSRSRLPIQDLLQKGQDVVVQITKDGIGGKGPTLTTYISLPGRYLVLMPSLGKCGVSRKIDDDKERERLKKLVRELADESGGIGFIVRTAGMNRTKKELQKDLDYLHKLWDLLVKRLKTARPPVALYEESDLAIKTMRDIFTPDIAEVIVDSEAAYKRILEFIEKLMPRHRNRLVHYEGSEPLFHHYGVEAEVESLFDTRVELKTGSSIVIDQTEALVAIDVNSGKFKKESDLEETAFQTNMESVPEIVRQIRLRDLGGVVVIDFIDMADEKHRRAVEKLLRDCFKGDRARVKLGKVSQFGMLELTRQRVGPGLKRMLFAPCPTCKGTGMVRSLSSQGLAVLRRLRATLRRKGVAGVEVTVHPDVADYLLNQKRDALLQIEQDAGRVARISGEPSFPLEGVHFRLMPQPGASQEAKPAVPAPEASRAAHPAQQGAQRASQSPGSQKGAEQSGGGRAQTRGGPGARRPSSGSRPRETRA